VHDETSTAAHPAQPYPWPPQSATGVGSMPGTDPVEATRLIFDELPGLPHLAELPGRGLGADLTGRAAAILVDLPVDATPRGWRFADRPGRDLRRAQGLLARDLDALEQVADGYRGALKIQVCGPWTMAATMELTRSQEPVLADPGAVGDLVASLAEGVTAHLADVRARVPGADVLLQLDEPALPAVLAGSVPSASGLNRVRGIEADDAESALRAVLSAVRAPGLVHCCAASVPLGIIRAAGARAAGIDLGQLRRGEEEVLAEAVEAGLGICLGAVPATPPAPRAARTAATSAAPAPRDHNAERSRARQPPSPRETAARVTELWRRMGWPEGRAPGTGPASAGRPASGPPNGTRQPAALTGAAAIAAQVVITPSCGLAGAPPEYAQAALARCREAARLLPELIEEESR
jgi:Cobalamin-independent synthase, Catalytic domain